ncbi:hypothetical protein HPB47_010125 [Ixodes persulcatus]|uniref:Uncharacterized protein n=1 Tax=Ixodes persulcatus TaxID=34615 RepID=A0AC60P026_IXOPE|nr:hypothetical protein HPB47_010125 [Ixodes persulcatus]
MIEIAPEFRLFSLLAENISKKYLIIGCAVFFFACMIIILVALSVTIATHRKFYYAFMPSEDTTSGGGGDGGGGVSPEEEKTTDIPCPLQGADCADYGCRAVEDSATGTRTCFLREDAFGYRYRHTTYGDREVNFSLSYDIARKSPFVNQVINNVKVQAVYITEDILRVRIHDEDRPRYEVPVSSLWTIPRTMPPINKDQLAYTIEANQTKKGYARIRILRTDNEIAMLDSWYPIMTEQFLQIVLPYSGQQIYGFGENGHDGIMLGAGSGTMFSRHGSNHSTKTWNSFGGVHPFFMNPKGDGTTWGVLLVNSNAMDYTVTGSGSIALAAIGGILDLYFFVGSTPNHVIQLYHKGLPSGLSAFPDFFKNRTRNWWKNLIEEYQGNVTEFNAIFLDVNEPAEFSADLNCQPGDASCQAQVCPESKWEDPPYLPFAYRESENRTKLHEGTLCMSAGMGEHQELPHYDLHSVYGWRQTWTTKTAMDDVSLDRTVLVSDSTYPSSGRFAGHILDSPDAEEWSSLRRAVVGVLEFNMFGIPYSSAIRRNRILSTRSAVLSSHPLLPFCFAPHELFGGTYSAMAATGHHTFGTRGYLSFPLDRATYDINDQFMWGSVLLFSPVLEENATKHTYYLPLDTWFVYPEGRRVEGSVDPMSRDVMDNTTVLIHVRAGHVVPVQPTLRLTHER